MQVTLNLIDVDDQSIPICDLTLPDTGKYPEVIIWGKRVFLRHYTTTNYHQVTHYVAESETASLHKAAQSLVDFIGSQIPSGSDDNARVLTTKILAGLPQVFTAHPEFLIEAVAAAGRTKRIEQ